MKCNNCEGRGYKMSKSTKPDDKCLVRTECMICHGTGLTYRHEDDGPYSVECNYAYWEKNNKT